MPVSDGGVAQWKSAQFSTSVCEGPILFTDNTPPIDLKLDESLGDQLNIDAEASGARTGTLERGDINSNIVGGVPPDYAGHHLIGIAEAQNFPVMQQAAKLGFDINEGSNGIALPTDPDVSVETDLPLHSGRHLGEYTDYVNNQLSQLQAQYDLGIVDDSNLLSAVRGVEDNIRNALLNANGHLNITP